MILSSVVSQILSISLPSVVPVIPDILVHTSCDACIHVRLLLIVIISQVTVILSKLVTHYIHIPSLFLFGDGLFLGRHSLNFTIVLPQSVYLFFRFIVVHVTQMSTYRVVRV